MMLNHARSPTAATAVAMSFVASSFAADTNATSLPSYPHDSSGVMDTDQLPNGQHCIQYATDSSDPLAEVEAWYKTQLPGAKAEDINIDSLSL